MSTWPEARKTTFVDNSTPVISADDLNAIQDEIVNIYGRSVGLSRASFDEDFDGYISELTPPAANTVLGRNHLFVKTNTSSLGSENGSIVNNASPEDGTYGSVLIENHDGTHTVALTLASCLFGLGTRDFRLSVRMKTKTLANLGSDIKIVVVKNSDATKFVEWRGATGAADWYTKIDNGSDTLTSVALSDNTWYVLVWQRISGVLYGYINGTQVYNAAYTTDLGAAQILFQVAGLGSLSANTILTELDYMRFDMPRANP